MHLLPEKVRLLPEDGFMKFHFGTASRQPCSTCIQAATEVYSPVSGTVTEKNAEVEETPSLINSSAEDKGRMKEFGSA